MDWDGKGGDFGFWTSVSDRSQTVAWKMDLLVDLRNICLSFVVEFGHLIIRCCAVVSVMMDGLMDA